jgi:aryl-alcohol dehydrogenase-like predicted oxidoreductase
LTITRIGLGASAIGGGDWIGGWGPQKDAESVATIRRAVDLGINWIDTAAVYGLGHSETLIARACRDIPEGERPYVFTTCGLVWDDLGNVAHSLDPQSIRREVEGSLRRLDVECIDLYQVGRPAWPNSAHEHVPGSLEAAWETMAALQREGKARFIGVANCDVNQLDRLGHIAPVTSLQTPYSLLRRAFEEGALTVRDDNTSGVIACSSLESGLLTGKMTPERINALPHNDWRRRSPSFQEPVLNRGLALVERLRAVGARHARTPGQVAIAWTLHHPVVTATCVGARQPYQVDEIVAAASVRLTGNEMGELAHASSLACAS